MKITGVRPWLVKASTSYWGEYLFVEVTTDEGVSGWGEITSTTKSANRALAAILRQVGDRIIGDADKAATLIAAHVEAAGRHSLEQMRASTAARAS